LSQGDVIVGVPFVVAPAKLVFVEDIRSEDEGLTARKVTAIPDAGIAFAVVQVERCDAVLLTYDCDIDRGLESIVRNEGPNPVELVTIAATRPASEDLLAKLDLIRLGRMPRFALIEARGSDPPLFVDFSSIQQISLRVLVPLAWRRRRCGMSSRGQLRLLERMAHSLGDVFRRNAVDGRDDSTLFERAAEVLG
jgi:hypothetical protein